jgi:hypothetical protein
MDVILADAHIEVSKTGSQGPSVHFHRNICSPITKWLYIFFLHIAIFLIASAEHKQYILTS